MRLGSIEGWELKIETLQRLLERKAGHRDSHLVMLVGFRVDLAGQQLIKEVGVGQFLFRRLLQTGRDFLLDLVERSRWQCSR
jgi:hypothetical protein